MQTRSLHRGALAAGLALIVAVGAWDIQAGASPAAAKSQFLSYNASKHTATLKLTAGLTSANHTLNFNGAISGGMVVSIPKGYRVKVVFTNNSTFPHSAVITTFANHTSEGDHPLAFPGASSPNPIQGTPAGQTVTFSFKATKVGTYAIICEVSHHADAGMWDTFKVTKSGKPSISVHAAPLTTPTATPTTAS